MSVLIHSKTFIGQWLWCKQANNNNIKLCSVGNPKSDLQQPGLEELWHMEIRHSYTILLRISKGTVGSTWQIPARTVTKMVVIMSDLGESFIISDAFLDPWILLNKEMFKKLQFILKTMVILFLRGQYLQQIVGSMPMAYKVLVHETFQLGLDTSVSIF